MAPLQSTGFDAASEWRPSRLCCPFSQHCSATCTSACQSFVEKIQFRPPYLDLFRPVPVSGWIGPLFPPVPPSFICYIPSTAQPRPDATGVCHVVDAKTHLFGILAKLLRLSSLSHQQHDHKRVQSEEANVPLDGDPHRRTNHAEQVEQDVQGGATQHEHPGNRDSNDGGGRVLVNC